MAERLVIGHQTALDFWRASRVASEGQHVLDDAGRLYGGRDLRLKECAALAANLCNSSTPVDAVVDAVAERRRCSDICDHVFSGPLTKAHLHDIDQYVSVCQAGPMLVQLATQLDQVDIALIAYELCGTYGLTLWAEDTFQPDLTALTSRAELMGYATSAKALGVRGATKAVSALGLVVDGSASPRETDLGVFLSLSRRLGGAELGGFVMNEDLSVPKRHQDALGAKSEVRPDFLWKDAKVLVEYDSNAHLIESCGLKGAMAGGAQISEEHANFIVNTGRASAADVVSLMGRAHDAVRDRFDIDLACEVKLLGFGA